MKKSNILLIIFCLLVPAGLVLYDALLVSAYAHGNSSRAGDFITLRAEQVNVTPLKPFKYLVMDGGVGQPANFSGRRYESDSYSQATRIEPGTMYAVEVSEHFRRTTKFEQRGDTLFVAFNSVIPRPSFAFYPLRIISPGIPEMRLSNGYYVVQNNYTADTVRITASRSKVDFQLGYCPAMVLDMQEGVTASLPPWQVGPQFLTYSMGKSSEIHLSDSYLGHLRAGALDSSATTIFTGRSPVVNQLLTTNAQ